MGQPIPLHELAEKYKNERPQREQELLGKLELVAAELHRESLWSGLDIERALVFERARREVERAAQALERDLATWASSSRGRIRIDTSRPVAARPQDT